MFGINLLFRWDKLQPKLEVICSISDHSVLFLDKTRLYLADVFNQTPFTKDPKWSLWKVSQAKTQQQETQTLPAKLPLEFVLCQLNTPDCNSLSEIPNIEARLHEKEAFYYKAKYLYPPEILTIQKIMKHIKQRKLKFSSVFIMVFNFLSSIFLPWK